MKKIIQRIKDLCFLVDLALGKSYDGKMLGFRTAWEVVAVLRWDKLGYNKKYEVK